MSKYSANDCFIAIYNKLLVSGKVATKREFSEKIGLLPASFNQIWQKKQNVTVDQIYRICSAFPEVSPNDFFPQDITHSSINISNVVLGNKNDINSNYQDLVKLLEKKDKLIEKKDEQIEKLLNKVFDKK